MKWINVENRLPNDHEIVIILRRNMFYPESEDYTLTGAIYSTLDPHRPWLCIDTVCRYRVNDVSHWCEILPIPKRKEG